MKKTKVESQSFFSKISTAFSSLFKSDQAPHEDVKLEKKKEKEHIKHEQESKKIAAKFVHDLGGLKSLLVTFKNQHTKQNGENILKNVQRYRQYIQSNQKELQASLSIGDAQKIFDAMSGVENTVQSFLDKSKNVYSANDINYEIKIFDELYHEYHHIFTEYENAHSAHKGN